MVKKTLLFFYTATPKTPRLAARDEGVRDVVGGADTSRFSLAQIPRGLPRGRVHCSKFQKFKRRPVAGVGNESHARDPSYRRAPAKRHADGECHPSGGKCKPRRARPRQE